MGTAAKPTRENRTITIDFHDEATYFRLIDDGRAFVEFILAFLLALGFQLIHKATCRGGGCLTRHSHYARVRLGGITIWRLQCKHGQDLPYTGGEFSGLVSICLNTCQKPSIQAFPAAGFMLSNPRDSWQKTSWRAIRESAQFPK
jgi:hypothetical protein